jgi:hypothetical protein
MDDFCGAHFSGSKPVRDWDQFSVSMMFCGATLGIIVILVRYLLHFRHV